MADYGRYSDLKVETTDSIAIITLNRPERLNAFTLNMHHELEEVMVGA